MQSQAQPSISPSASTTAQPVRQPTAPQTAPVPTTTPTAAISATPSPQTESGLKGYGLDASDGISVLALIVSIVVGFVAWRTSSRQNDLQKRLTDIEEARERDRIRVSQSADVSASIGRYGKSYRLVVQNAGAATARAVKVLLDGQPVLAHRLVPRGESEITTLGPGVTATYVLAVSMGSGALLDVAVTWEDDSGRPGRWASQLKLF